MNTNELEQLGWHIDDYTTMDEPELEESEELCWYDTQGNVGVCATTTREGEFIECKNPVEIRR